MVALPKDWTPGAWKAWLGQRPGLRRILTIALIFWAIALTFALHRYWTFYASYDQGIFNQVFWNNLHGRWFESSLSSSLSSAVKQDDLPPEVFYRRLGQHFTPALLFWLPIYALHAKAVTLVWIQVSAIAAAGLVLYALARQHLGTGLSVWIAGSYYAANAVIGPTFSNFHDLCQIPLYTFSLLLAMEKRRWALFWPIALAILAVREDMGFVLFGVGVYMVLSRRFPAAGLGACTLGFLYILVCTNIFMPIFSPDISKRFAIERFGQYVDGDEASTIDLLRGMVTQPWLLIGELINPPLPTLKYLLGQWLPLGLIPALSPAAWAIAGFPLLKIFLQQGEAAMSINIRYAIVVVPGMFYGAILWWSSHGSALTPRFKQFWKVCIGLSLFFSIVSSPHRVFYFAIPDSIDPWVHVSLPEQWSHSGHIRRVSDRIEPEASVAATTYMVPPLSSRRAIVRLPWHEVLKDGGEVQAVDYLLADTWHLRRYLKAFRKEWIELAESMPLFDQSLTNGSYGVVALEDGVVLFQRGVPSDPEVLPRWMALREELIPLIQAGQPGGN
jgi:uncharacterized membrane protein